MMIRATFWLTLFLVISSFFETMAGCAYDARMASISLVSVSSRVPKYEPLPNNDPKQLESDIDACATDFLKRHGFTVGNSDVSLDLRVRYTKTSGGTLVLVVQLDVVEPALLVREAEGTSKEEGNVISWQRIQIVESSGVGAEETIIETVGSLLTDFYEEVVEARNGTP